MNSSNAESTHPAASTARPKLWSLPYALTLVAVCVASITMTFFMPLLPIYIKMIGGSLSLAGLVVSIYTIAALISRPFFAIWIDRFGRKPILLIGLALVLVGCFSYRFVTIIGVLMLIRFIHGIGYSASTNAAGTIAADVVPKERRGQGIGYYGFVIAASLALGPAAALLIMKSTDIKTAFAVAAGIAAFGLIVSFFLSYEKKPAFQPSGESAAKALARKGPTQLARLASGYEKTALPASLVMLFVAFAYSGIVTFLPAYAGTLGMKDISIYFIVYAVVLLVTRLIVDQVTRKRDLSVVLLPGILLMAVAFILLGFGKTLPFFLGAAVFYGIGYGSVQPTLNAMVISACASSRRSAANSTFFSTMDLGIGLGALAWGEVSEFFGYPAIYFGCIACMFLAGLAFWLVMNKKQGSNGSE
jgi:predicted MFS family arabinose efflux permease